MKYRQHTHDAPIRPKSADVVTRIPIVDERGQERGHVHGLGASEATIRSKFGIANAKLKRISGKLTWAGESGANTLRRQQINREQRVKANKGSVSFKPSPPQTSARPKRGH
jgi:hypothetical protein